MQTLPSKEEFLQWLMNVPDSEVFIAGDAEYCPLAVWMYDALLQQPHEVELVAVCANHVDCYFVRKPGRHIPLDTWMVEFSTAFDSRYREDESVTAAQLKDDIVNHVL